MNLHLYPESFVKNQASFYISNQYLLFIKCACAPALLLWRTTSLYQLGSVLQISANPASQPNPVSHRCWMGLCFMKAQTTHLLFPLFPLRKFLLLRLPLSHHNKKVLGNFNPFYEVLNQSDSQIKAHLEHPPSTCAKACQWIWVCVPPVSFLTMIEKSQVGENQF